MSAEPDRLLEIYLADHSAAATAGAALASRAARSNVKSEYGAFLRRLTAEVEEDRRTLRAIVGELGFAESKTKEMFAWVAEKAGRLKLNGQIRGYSPLSRVLELEALSVGVAGKLALWQSLHSVPNVSRRLSRFDLEGLEQRAREQRAEVEEYRLRAAREAFAGGLVEPSGTLR